MKKHAFYRFIPARPGITTCINTRIETSYDESLLYMWITHDNPPFFADWILHS